MSKARADRPIFIDIDGTLTNEPEHPWGKVHTTRIDKINRLVELGYQIVIWSGNGTTYARAFAERHGLKGVFCIGKPQVFVDDNPKIRPMEYCLPEDFFAFEEPIIREFYK